ncbi:MAG: hypothetical protein P4L79_11070 [Legionella sp.]|uniref:hypothetical protein n=1 Tax=Legionella sp. TaxID=459 RepID=UPI00284A51E9|nr:hypothetical protein [Legionella sp.]
MGNLIDAARNIVESKNEVITESVVEDTEITYEVGDVLEDKDGIEGVVTSITETEMSIDWLVDGQIKEEVVPLQELGIVKIRDYHEKGLAAAFGKNDPKRESGLHLAMRKVHGGAKIKANVKKQIGEKEMNVDEETLAASSLHPGAESISDPKSKLEAITRALGVFAKMEKGDLIDFFNKSISQIGTEAKNVPAGVAAKNKHTIDAKTVAKEAIEDLFSGEELTEEFKIKATTLFESAVTARVLVETEKLEEAYEATLNEELTTIHDELNEKVEAYLEASSKKWLEENAIAVESALRNRLMENFIDGLKTLFEDHYIDVPEDKVSVIESLIEKNEELEGRIDELMTVNSELNDSLTEAAKEYVFLEASKGLPVDQIEKFASLSESVEFEGSEEAYLNKLNLIKEAHFSKKPVQKVQDLNEEYIEVQEDNKVRLSPEMSLYSKAISRTV